MGEQLDGVWLGLAAVTAVIFIIIVIWIALLGSKLKRLRKQYTAMMNGNGIHDLEGVINNLQERLHIHETTSVEQTGMLKELANALGQIKGKIGIIRYNAFSEQGSDMSFSIAITNESRDGIVLSGIHGRDETYVYAKPLKQGESPYPLTPEEKQAISQAEQQK
jgi:hypothetical protein